MVRKEAVRNDGTQLKTANPAADRAIVEANTQAIADVRLSHRTDIRRARARADHARRTRSPRLRERDSIVETNPMGSPSTRARFGESTPVRMR
jgi:hypothetical protein